MCLFIPSDFDMARVDQSMAVMLLDSRNILRKDGLSHHSNDCLKEKRRKELENTTPYESNNELRSI